MPSGRPWFRHYTRARTDPRLLSLSDKAYRAFWGLVEMAAENDPQGYVQMSPGVPWPKKALAQALNIDARILQKVCIELAQMQPGGIEFAENGCIFFAKFALLNPPSDLSVDRVRRHRAQTSNVTPPLHETLLKRSREEKSKNRNVTVSKDTVVEEKVRVVFEGLKERRGYASPKGMAEGAAVRKMLKKTLIPEEILECWDAKKSEAFWRDKELWMMTVEGQIQAWKANKNGRFPNATSAVPQSHSDRGKYAREKQLRG